MRGTTGLLTAKNILKGISLRGRWGTMTISPKKHGNDIGEGGSPVTDDKAEPIVAFSKPPLPPVMGPFLVFSLLEMVSGHDKND
ncbi:hypothetical protein IFM89_023723 [Coptis chinensis]|uniref:Uncharacterized protein n=1 Tax=Coptis chinensis TaxID=261450 RepID=A0A835ICG8_9MAGN|nr:hypothetical protein IFM89_023723 [Coptis chinensis]